MKTTKIDPVKQLADKLISQMENNTAPWQRPWENSLGGTPHNALTKKSYRGYNNLSLLASEYKDPRWLTFKQAKELGCAVKKGEKGTPLLFYNFTKEVAKRDDNGKFIKDEEGNTIKELIRLDAPFIHTFYVFNAEQIEGMTPYEPFVRNEIEINDRAEALLTASGANITNIEGNQAFYRPITDEIILPLKEQFKSSEHYYSTALHELGHWSGHESRLNRDLVMKYGSPDYAREELRAEISSMLVCQELNLRHDPSNHIAYTQSWVEVLKNNPKEILYACRDAQKIFDFVMQFDREYIQQHAPDVDQDRDDPEPEMVM